MRRTFVPVLFLAALFFSSCYRVPDKIEPKLSYSVEEGYIKHLTPPFHNLSQAEKDTDWGKEFTIGKTFAQDFDLYRAITAYKRAEILIPPSNHRKIEIQYYITLSYYLGKKYGEAINYFDKTDLSRVDKSFPAYHDLLIILYESYRQVGDEEKSARIHELIQEMYPETAEKMTLFSTLMSADLPELRSFSQKENFGYVNDLMGYYDSQKKSVGGAQALNAFLPGAGYFYIGQKKTAVTALLLNSLFIYAAYQFFHHGYIAAGIITTSFEMGWYFGGIYGAGEEAKFYNERVYERAASNMMNGERLFPVLMIKHAF